MELSLKAAGSRPVKHKHRKEAACTRNAETGLSAARTCFRGHETHYVNKLA